MTRASVLSWVQGNAVALLSLLAGALLALGFVVESPASQIRAVRSTVDTVGHRVTALEQRVGGVEQQMALAQIERREATDSLLRMIRQIQAAECLVGDTRDLSLIGIACSTVVKAARREAAR